MDNPPYVPYQAYKVSYACVAKVYFWTYLFHQSKRHSRVSSNPQAIPNSITPVQARPVPNPANGHVYSDSVVARTENGLFDAEKRSMAIMNGRSTLQRPVSMIDSLPHLRQERKQSSEPGSEEIVVEKLVEKPVEALLPPPIAVTEVPVPATLVSPTPTPPSRSPPLVSSPAPAAVSLPATPPSQATSPKVNGKAIVRTSSPVAGPSTLPTASTDRSVASPRKTSTFRPLRPPPSRQALPSSPLRPASMIIQGSSSLLTPPRPAERTLGEPRSNVSSVVSSPSMPAQDRALPPIPAFELQSQRPLSQVPTQAPSPAPIAPSPTSFAPSTRASSLAPSPFTDTAPPSRPTSSSPSPAVTPSTSTSSAVPAGSRVARSPAPYRPGFQPRGVYRPRTDEFVAARGSSRDVGRIERTRLERRLEKLIQLHFPPPGARGGKQEAAAAPRPAQQQNRRASSFWDLDLSDLRNKSAGDLWREVVQSQAAQGGKNDIRGGWLCLYSGLSAAG